MAQIYRPDGYLYDKESILEYVITKKNENSRKWKAYEKQKRNTEQEITDKETMDKITQVNKFVKQENDITINSALDTKRNSPHL